MSSENSENAPEESWFTLSKVHIYYIPNLFKSNRNKSREGLVYW